MSEPAEKREGQGFEGSLEELERIVRELEGGQLGLDDSLARYERGVGLLKECYAHLQRAERKIELLRGVGPDGEERAEPWDDSATFQEDGRPAGPPESPPGSPPGSDAPRKPKKKAARRRPPPDVDGKPGLF